MSTERVQIMIERLERWFAECESCVVAFSGGIDSSLVAYLARNHLGRERCLAVVGNSASLKTKDLADARQFADRYDIPLRIIETEELSSDDYRINPENRCFHCKSELFSKLDEVRRELGFRYILGGENLDDHGDYRPGLQAAAKFEVRGPLAECSITKNDLRAIARSLELECWEKPASPCLSSRIPYFQEITAIKLRQIEAGESFLAERGFPVSRVRHHDSYARIEVPHEQVPDLRSQETVLAEAFAELGFTRIEIDPEGFVSGKLNRELE